MLPPDCYHDAEVFRREKARVFARTWQVVGRSQQVRLPGEYFTCSVADEDVVVTRAGALHALSAVCRHRAGPVARGSGQRKSLQCGYHGWTYSLDGRLQAAPGFEGAASFDVSGVCLPSYRVGEWGGFVFVNLSRGSSSLADALGAIPEETRRLPLERMSAYKRADYEIGCNWKVCIDTFLDNSHIPIVHPGLSAEIDVAAYRLETRDGYSRQRAPLRGGPDGLFGRGLKDGAPAEALYYWVFPNLMVSVYPDTFQVAVVQPLAPERTLTRLEWYVLDPTRAGVAQQFERVFAFADQVQREDAAICEAVQRGLRSGPWSAARHPALHEAGVQHFHGLLAGHLADDAVSRSAPGGRG